MILGADTTVHDLLAGCPELRPYVEALLPPADLGIGAVGAAKRRRLTTIADVARGANLTHHELLRDLQAEAARLGVADAVAGAGAGVSSLEEADDLETLVEQLEQGRDLLELATVVRRVGLDAHRGVSAGPHRAAPEESSGAGAVTDAGDTSDFR